MNFFSLGCVNDRTVYFLFQNQGSALVACGDRLERDWQVSAKYDTEQLQNAIKNVKAGLQDVHSDVTCLRKEAHALIEATRGQAQQLRVSIYNLAFT